MKCIIGANTVTFFTAGIFSCGRNRVGLLITIDNTVQTCQCVQCALCIETTLPRDRQSSQISVP